MKKHILLITISMLILPLVLIAIAWVVFNKFIFDNPNFWYGYMAYFGTIVLASVSLWQNENAKETNERMTQQQLRQKIGYFSLKENEGEMRKINKFSDIQVGQIYSLDRKLDESEEKKLNVFLKNIGEDLIILKSLNASINNISTSVPCYINNILKNETIAYSIHRTARNLNGSYGDSATLSTGGGYLLSIKVGTEPCGLKASGLRKQPLRRASLKTKATITSMTNGTLIYRTRQSKHPLLN